MTRMQDGFILFGGGFLLLAALRWALGRIAPTSLRPYWIPLVALPFGLLLRPDVPLAGPLGSAKYVFSLAASLGALLWLLEARVVRPARLVLLPFLLLVSGILAVQPPGESDEPDYLLLAESLRSDGDMYLDDEFRSDAQIRILGSEPPLFADEILRYRADSSLPPRPSLRAPLGGAIFVPGLALQALARRAGAPRAAGWYCLYLAPTLLLAAALAGILRDAPSFSPAVLLFALAPPLFYYASQAQPEILAVLLVGVAVEAISADRAPRAALAIALLPLAHYRLGLLAALLAGWMFLRGARAAAALGLASGGAIAGGFWFFSSAEISGGAGPALAGLSKGLEFGRPIWELGNVLEGLYHLVVSPRVGILVWFPGALLVVRGARDPRARAPLAIAAGYLVIMAGYRAAADSFPYARYMIPAIPLLAPAILSGAERSPRAARLLAAATAALYLLVASVPLFWRLLLVRG